MNWESLEEAIVGARFGNGKYVWLLQGGLSVVLIEFTD